MKPFGHVLYEALFAIYYRPRIIVVLYLWQALVFRQVFCEGSLYQNFYVIQRAISDAMVASAVCIAMGSLLCRANYVKQPQSSKPRVKTA